MIVTMQMKFWSPYLSPSHSAIILYMHHKISINGYCNASMTQNVPCKCFDTLQPSRMFTDHCVYSRKLQSIISRAQSHWISTKVRYGPERFQKAHVTAVKVVALLLAAFLRSYYTISTKNEGWEKQLASQNTQYMFFCIIGIENTLTAMCCSGVTPFSSLSPPNLVLFFRRTLAQWRVCR